MSKFKCKCLNVTVHVKEKAIREVDGKAFVSNALGSTFFASELCEVELAVGGITTEVASLVRLAKVEDWDIFTCINCGMETHALHAVKKYDRVIMNRAMESNSDVINHRVSSPEYSAAFKVILEPVTGSEQPVLDSSFAGNAILLGKDNISLAMVGVQDQAKKFLESEEKAVADRIRRFIEEQKKELSALQSQVYKDKQAVHWVIRKADEKTMEESLHEAIADDSSDSPILQSRQMLNKPAFILQEHKDEPDNHVHITQVSSQKAPFHRPEAHTSYSVKRLTQKSHEKDSHVPLESDANPMFQLDDFTDDCEPFFESEEDDLSSDNSFQSEDAFYNPRLRGIKKLPTEYSSSAPIRMPVAKYSPPDNGVEFPIPEPSKIRESMKAIARSVHDSSRELFGELPRPRTNTYSYR